MLVSLVALLALIAGSVQGVVINEFYYGTEPPGDNEWIELYNRSAVDIDLQGWQIAVSNNADFQTTHTIMTGDTSGTLIGAGEFFLIAGSGAVLEPVAPSTDTIIADEPNVNLGLGRYGEASVVYGIALLDDSGSTIDTVLYAPSGPTNTWNLVDDTGSSDVLRAKVITMDEVYYRNPIGQDTDDSSVDFQGSGDTLGSPVPVGVSRFELQ
jgi:hypothetical protein